MSWAVAGTPSSGPAAWAAVATTSAAPNTSKAARHPATKPFDARLDVGIAHAPVGGDFPRVHGVVVVEGRRAVAGDPLVARLLHPALVVGGAALQQRRSAVPAPGQPEAGEALLVLRAVQRGFRPGLAAVRGDF